MYGLLLKIIYVMLLAFFVLSVLITTRDLIRGENKRPMTISAMGLLLIFFVFLFKTTSLPILMLPLVAMVALPIFLTDANRNWDIVDRFYRWVTLGAAVSGVIMMTYTLIR